MMVEELCRELNNYFDRGQPRFSGEIVIENGMITNPEFLERIRPNQYFRIVGSTSNDGAYCFNEGLLLEDETFRGALQLMAVPKAFLDLADSIEKWIDKYQNDVESPYQSEAFGGYSRTLASGKNGGSVKWQDVFAQRLNMYRRIRL